MTRPSRSGGRSTSKKLTLLEIVNEAVGTCCRTTRCRDQRCELRLPGGGDLNCLHGDSYTATHQHDKKLADCIIFWDDQSLRTIAIAELKGGSPDVRHAVQQIQAGADLVISKIAGEELARCTFVPILVHQAISKIELDVLAKERVRFRGKSVPVSRAKCGAELTTILEKAKL